MKYSKFKYLYAKEKVKNDLNHSQIELKEVNTETEISRERKLELWIPHLIMVLSLLAGCFKLKYAICKKFIGIMLLIFHSFWLVGDLMCYTPIISSTMALFGGMYFTLLVTIGVFDGLLVYCKCWGKRQPDEPVLDKLLREIEEAESDIKISIN